MELTKERSHFKLKTIKVCAVMFEDLSNHLICNCGTLFLLCSTEVEATI